MFIDILVIAFFALIGSLIADAPPRRRNPPKPQPAPPTWWRYASARLERNRI